MAFARPKIVVVPLGEVDFMMVNKLATNIGPVFNRSVDILKGMKMPEESYNVIRNQYYAAIILAKLERVKANQREHVIGVCEEDIYLPDEAYVLAHADSVLGTAVVSLNKIRQEFYGLPEDDTKVYDRLYKLAVDQVSFLCDVAACRNPKCVHYYSQTMMDIDNKGSKLCDICKRQLINRKK
ncbi:MAG: hypothetical protein JW763_09180 [candidate division Zixibacteria bacterium]|nr:hypothetical protein [candidate division Zixibacteria bacterium]